MAAETVNVQGLAEVMANLKALAPDLEKKVLDKAGLAAATVFRDEMRLRAPVMDQVAAEAKSGKGSHLPPGTLRDSIHIVKKRYLAPGSVLGYQAATGKKAFYADWLELGFHNVKSGGFVQVPYARPAYEAKKMQALQIFVDAIQSALDNMQNGKIMG